MKKNIIPVSVSAALALCALTSCDKENSLFSGRIGTNTIGISSVKATDPATKAVTEEASQVTLEDGSVFTIHKTIEPYTTGPQTKADIKKTENITDFTLYGYLDADEIAKAESASEADKSNNQFISGAKVIKGDDGKFHTVGDYFWRQNITHYFWAQSGLDKMETTANSASFSKTAGSDEDILVAYASKKWYEHSGDNHSSDKLDITFKHALSASTYQRGTVTYIQKDTTEPVQKDRVSLYDIKLLRKKQGTCTVSPGLNFNWNNLNTTGADEIPTEGEIMLSIPQNESVLEVYYTDKYRAVTRPVLIPLDDNWQAGYKYNYTLTGTVSVPKWSGNPPEEGKEGIDFNFIGNEKRSEALTTKLDVTYYKKIEISWDNLPTTNGNKTYAIVYYGKDKIDVSNIDNVISDSHVIFVYDIFRKSISIIRGEGSEINNNHCSLILDTEQITGDINIYIGYHGGSNGQGGDGTKWKIQNLSFKVLEYK